MEKYETPQMEIIRFETEDIVLSSDGMTNWTDIPYNSGGNHE